MAVRMVTEGQRKWSDFKFILQCPWLLSREIEYPIYMVSLKSRGFIIFIYIWFFTWHVIVLCSPFDCTSLINKLHSLCYLPILFLHVQVVDVLSFSMWSLGIYCMCLCPFLICLYCSLPPPPPRILFFFKLIRLIFNSFIEI